MKRYALLLACTVLLVLIVAFCFAQLSPAVTNAVDEGAMKRFELGLSAFGKNYEDGVPLTDAAVQTELRYFARAQNFVVLGSSTTRQGVLTDMLNLPEGWRYLDFSVPGTGVNELYMMTDFLTKFSGHEFTKSDIVKIDIGPGMFKLRSMDESILAETLDKAGYAVSDDLSVSAVGSPALANLQTRAKTLYESVFEQLLPASDEAAVEALTGEARYSEYRERWERSLDDFDLTEGESERFLQLLLSWKGRAQVVVESVYCGSWLRDTEQAIAYYSWVEESLKPFLKTNGIAFIDTSAALIDDSYSEQSHLSYAGRAVYTDLENGYISRVIQALAGRQ